MQMLNRVLSNVLDRVLNGLESKTYFINDDIYSSYLGLLI